MTRVERLQVETPGRGFTDVTQHLTTFVRQLGTGLLTVFIQHTSASVIISENADPTVRDDLERFFSKLVPDGDGRFEHDAEGPDDMPSHVRAVLTQTSVGIPVSDGRLLLGTWQAVYLYEHRTQPHRRTLVVCFQD